MWACCEKASGTAAAIGKAASKVKSGPTQSKGNSIRYVTELAAGVDTSSQTFHIIEIFLRDLVAWITCKPTLWMFSSVMDLLHMSNVTSTSNNHTAVTLSSRVWHIAALWRPQLDMHELTQGHSWGQTPRSCSAGTDYSYLPHCVLWRERVRLWTGRSVSSTHDFCNLVNDFETFLQMSFECRHFKLCPHTRYYDVLHGPLADFHVTFFKMQHPACRWSALRGLALLLSLW